MMPNNKEGVHIKAGLSELGWSNYFIQQLSLDEWDDYTPARIIEQHRSELIVATDQDSFSVALPANLDSPVCGGWTGFYWMIKCNCIVCWSGTQYLLEKPLGQK